MNAAQLTAFLKWAENVTQCVGRLTHISYERRLLLETDMSDLAATHGHRFDTVNRTYVPNAPSPASNPEL